MSFLISLIVAGKKAVVEVSLASDEALCSVVSQVVFWGSWVVLVTEDAVLSSYSDVYQVCPWRGLQSRWFSFSFDDTLIRVPLRQDCCQGVLCRPGLVADGWVWHILAASLNKAAALFSSPLLQYFWPSSGPLSCEVELVTASPLHLS